MSEQKYFCGICGWVNIEKFPNCHETSVKAVDSEAEARRMKAFEDAGIVKNSNLPGVQD